MEEFGQWLTEIGLTLMPYSFAIYFPLRWAEYKWKHGNHRLVKAAWYFALGVGYVSNSFEVNYVVMFICFIESWDLIFQQLEIQRKRE